MNSFERFIWTIYKREQNWQKNNHNAAHRVSILHIMQSMLISQISVLRQNIQEIVILSVDKLLDACRQKIKLDT